MSSWSWDDYEKEFGPRPETGMRSRASRSQGAPAEASAETVVPAGAVPSEASDTAPSSDAAPCAAESVGAGAAEETAPAGEDLPVVAPPAPETPANPTDAAAAPPPAPETLEHQ